MQLHSNLEIHNQRKIKQNKTKQNKITLLFWQTSGALELLSDKIINFFKLLNCTSKIEIYIAKK